MLLTNKLKRKKMLKKKILKKKIKIWKNKNNLSVRIRLFKNPKILAMGKGIQKLLILIKLPI
jgi:hypothetical protein